MSRPVILLVDDEAIVLTSLKRQLIAQLGSDWAIETAESADEALEVVDELEGDGIELPLVISDHLMPGMRGADLLVALHERMPLTVKVMLTGQADAEAVGTVANAGALYRYIAKPWEQADLILTVREALRGYRRDRQLDEQNRDLNHARATLQRLVAGIAHEANSPIGAIASSADLMKTTLRRSEEAFASGDFAAGRKLVAGTSGSIDVVVKSAARLAGLIESTQRFVSLDEGERKHVDIGQRLDDALRLVAATAGEVSISRTDSVEEEAIVICHPSQLSEVLVTLLDHAARSGGRDGAVRASLSTTKDIVTVVVEDDGPGMSPEEIRDAFLPNVAARPNEVRAEVRLGLALCKRHIEAAGGTIALESRRGVGSRVTMKLPRHVRHQA